VKKGQLSAGVVQDIVDNVLKKYETHEQTAIKFKISKNLVFGLVKGCRDNPDFVSDISKKAVKQ
jgi:hypothetical protein